MQGFFILLFSAFSFWESDFSNVMAYFKVILKVAMQFWHSLFLPAGIHCLKNVMFLYTVG